MSTVFSGTTAESLLDFGSRYPQIESRRLLAEFCDVVIHPTTKDWTTGVQVPKGEPLLRARCFLSLAGYRVSEFDKLAEPTRQFAMMMALGVMTVDEVQRELGYAHLNGIYDIALRGRLPVKDRLFRLQRLVKSKLDEINAKMAEWKQRIEEELRSDRDVVARSLGSVAIVMARSSSPPMVEELHDNKAVSPASSKRTRSRSDRKSAEGKGGDPVMVLTHLLLAVDTVLYGLDKAGRKEVATQLVGRVVDKRLERVQALIEQARKG